MSIPRITELLESINTKLGGDVTVSVSIVDDGTVDLSTEVVDAIIEIWVSDYSERLKVFLASDGTITTISATDNTAVTDSDTKLCIYWSTDHAIIKNRLGSSKTVKYILSY
jgi:hypothetical protein